jgi:pimeloyl-ACP methyl ester carboxylesterase
MTHARAAAATSAAILTRPDGSRLAYRRHSGIGPGVVFLGGFHSDMTGNKATHLEVVCRRLGRAYLRFDYYGHGESSGRFEDGTIGRWRDDALAVLDILTEGPQLLVGSSMGGWIMVLAALARPHRIAGLIGVAAAPDFVTELLEANLPSEARSALDRDGIWHRATQYGPDPYPIRRVFLDEAKSHIVLDRPIAFDGPVRLIHGMADPDVPYALSIRLAERLTSTDVTVTLVKDGDHRLSSPADLDRLGDIVAGLAR